MVRPLDSDINKLNPKPVNYRRYNDEQVMAMIHVQTLVSEWAGKRGFRVASHNDGKRVKTMRELRLMLKNVELDMSQGFLTYLYDNCKKQKEWTQVTKQTRSPNSSKYSSVTFKYGGCFFDIVVARGANNGEKFEKQTVNDLKSYFGKAQGAHDMNQTYNELIAMMIRANREFRKNEISEVQERTGSTRKTGTTADNLGDVIADLYLIEQWQGGTKKWNVSLKDVNGSTFSSYPGAGTLFDKSTGLLNPKSQAAQFLETFGVDLNRVQRGFDDYAKAKNVQIGDAPRPRLPPPPPPNRSKIKDIFEHAWGVNYFYVRKTPTSWKVFYMYPRTNGLLSNIAVDISKNSNGWEKGIRYPSASAKQITIAMKNQHCECSIEMRNSSGGLYPNDIKFTVESSGIIISALPVTP